MTRFARAARRPKPMLPSERYDLLSRVVQDQRFRALPPRSALCLVVAIVLHVDLTGQFWPKVKTWAAEVGVSPSTVQRAIRDLEGAGLITREPHLRPDGSQGSTTYFVDLALVAPTSMPVEKSGARVPSGIAGGSGAESRQGRSLVTQRHGRSAVTPQNGSRNGKRGPVGTKVVEGLDQDVGKGTAAAKAESHLSVAESFIRRIRATTARDTSPQGGSPDDERQADDRDRPWARLAQRAIGDSVCIVATEPEAANTESDDPSQAPHARSR